MDCFLYNKDLRRERFKLRVLILSEQLVTDKI